MQLNGLWLLCADGVVRPVIRGEVLAGDGARIQTLFLIDTGADRTVFSANIFTALRRLPLTQTEQLGGVGGRVTAVLVETQIEIQRDDGGIAAFRGQFAALTDPEALDMSVLGRDISNLFAVIVDRPRDLICLLGQQHRYVITQQS
jgi:hypothetical protein